MPEALLDIPRLARALAKQLDPSETSMLNVSILERALYNARQEGRELAKSDDPSGALHRQRRAYKTARSAIMARKDFLEHKLEALHDVLSNDEINDKGKIIVALGIINDTLVQRPRG